MITSLDGSKPRSKPHLRTSPMDNNPTRTLHPEPLWAEWSDVWPEAPEPGCLAACFADLEPTDSDAEVTGLGHAYVSVAANEGVRLFQLLLFSGTALMGLSVWLVVHTVQTQELSLLAALIPPVLLACYCCGYISLKYRLRRLLLEIVRFGCIDLPVLSVKLLTREIAVLLGAPGWLAAKCFVVSMPGYQRKQERLDSRGKLCSVCKTMVTGSRLLTGSDWPFRLTRSSERWQHHSLKMLRQCAKHCHLCSLLLLSISEDSIAERCDILTRRDEKGTGPLQILHRDGGSNVEETLRACIWQQRSWRTGLSQLRMRLDGRGAEEAHPLVIEVDESETVMPEWTMDDSSNWSVAKTWIESCSGGHELCQNDFAGPGGCTVPPVPFIPSRLVEIVQPQCCVGEDEKPAGTISVKLVETGSQRYDCAPAYIVFGRSWGRNGSETAEDPATESSADHCSPLRHQHRCPVASEALPGACQRAVSIACRLGFRYLWIDDLCAERSARGDILPDESHATLALVYVHATCTVSTAEPTDLLSKSARRFDDCPLLLNTLSTRGKQSAFVARAPITPKGESSAGIDVLFERCVDSHPPNRQRWSFQERLLSRRLLFVCEDEPVFFECNTLRVSSLHPRGIPYLPQSAVCQSKPRSHHRDPSLGADSTPLNLTYTYWTRKKVVDAEKGVWKFETLVVPTPQPTHAPTVQEQLERLQGIRAWRRHCGSFHRLLRRGVDGRSEPEEEEHNNCWAEKLALNEAWFGLVGAYLSFEQSSTASKLDAMKGVVSLITKAHNVDGDHVQCFEGVWLGLLPLNLLWFRSGEGNVLPKAGKSSLLETPTWSWTSTNAPFSHGLAEISLGSTPREEIRKQNGGRGLQHVQPPVPSQSRDRIWRRIHVIPLIKEVATSGLPSETRGPGLHISHLCDLFPVDKIIESESVEIVYDDPELSSVPTKRSRYILPLALISYPTKGASEVGAVDLWRQNPKGEVHGILIATNDDNPDGGYDRIGYFRLRQRELVEEVIRSVATAKEERKFPPDFAVPNARGYPEPRPTKESPREKGLQREALQSKVLTLW